MLVKSVLILSTVLLSSDAAFVDTLKKCGKNDGECHREMIQNVLKEASKPGIQELNIPPFDPVVLKDVSIPILNVVDLELADGVVRGMRNCVVNSFVTAMEKGKASMDITCDLVVKGKYKAFSNSPLVKSVLGADKLRGDGNAKLKIEQLNVKFDFHFFIEERDGETYIKCKDKKLDYKYEVKGKVVFAADHLYLDDKDASEVIVNLLNQNWRLVVESAGQQLMGRAMDRIKVFFTSFFGSVPTKYYIIDDLTPYVK
uniref:Odorant-binding protein 3 n=1 Tax=Cnaphalocrocis medinalis TaxID=437488 RepID=A0A0U2QG64_CNAME|nr:odorant-binding protein 3 [Cnaphalocrocis medinalis]